jgi:hypothetical protein
MVRCVAHPKWRPVEYGTPPWVNQHLDSYPFAVNDKRQRRAFYPVMRSRWAGTALGSEGRMVKQLCDVLLPLSESVAERG